MLYDRLFLSNSWTTGTYNYNYYYYYYTCTVGSTLSNCRRRPCHNGGLCYEGWHGDIKCVCRDGFTGLRCGDRVDPCDSHPCLQDGVCRRRKGRRRPDRWRGGRRHRWRPYRCICLHGYTGAYCQFGPGGCASSPCPNGKICKDIVGGEGYACKSTSIVFENDIVSSSDS